MTIDQALKHVLAGKHIARKDWPEPNCIFSAGYDARYNNHNLQFQFIHPGQGEPFVIHEAIGSHRNFHVDDLMADDWELVSWPRYAALHLWSERKEARR